MPGGGIYLRLTHIGPQPRSSLFLNDVEYGEGGRPHAGHGGYPRHGVVYVPASGSVDVVFTSTVALSYESGAIAGFIQRGLLSATFVVGAPFASAVQRTLDWQNSVLTVILNNALPPPTQVLGDRYLLSDTGGAPNPAWGGATAGSIVEFNGSLWMATPPQPSMVVVADDTNNAYIYNNLNTWAAFGGGGGGPAKSVLHWGNSSVTATVTTRFLSPGWEDGLAPTTVIRWEAPFAGTLKNLHIRHNAPAGNGNNIIYTVRVNGAASLLTVSLASTGASGSNVVNTAVVAAGDLLDIRVTKALNIGATPQNVLSLSSELLA